MHISCNLAGTLLAKLGRPEVSNCIAGLRQYSYAYEEAAEQANEMEALFSRVRVGKTVELIHMASVTPRVGSASPSGSGSQQHSPRGHSAMVVDEHHGVRQSSNATVQVGSSADPSRPSCLCMDYSRLLQGHFINPRFTDSKE